METTIGNVITIKEPNGLIMNYCKNNLILDNPDYINAERMGRWCGNIDKKLYLYTIIGNSVILPFGCLTDIWEFIKGCKYTLLFNPLRKNNLVGSINLYDYQQSALNGLKSGKNGILQAPCGSGKTQIGLELIKEIGGRALWLTHTGDLLKQSKERAKAYFKGDFGEITEGKVNIGKDITFATVQTMSKIDPEIYKNAFDIVVVDEVQHLIGTPTRMMMFYKVVNNCNCRYKFGLSATLDRPDGMIKSTFAIIGNILYAIPKSAVGDKIIKAEHRKVDVNIDYDPRDYLASDGMIDYMGLIDTLSNNTERNQLIIDNVHQEYQKGSKQLILCHRVKQVETLTQEISKFCKCSAVTGKVSNKNRNYDADVIVATYSLAKEGLDIPTLNVLHLATPQKNDATTEQCVGRIERNIEGKQTPICYDYVDLNIPYCMICYYKRRRIINKSKRK